MYETRAGTQTCPRARVLEDAVSARLGYEPWRSGAAQRFRTVLERKREGFTARVQLETDEGKTIGVRNVGPQASCDALIEGIALAISIVIDPLSAHRTPPEPVPTAPIPPDPQLDLRLQLAGGFFVTGLSAPKITAGFQLGILGRLGQFAFGLEGRGDIPGRLEVEGGRISTSLLLGSALGCFHYEAFGACLVASLGTMRADADALVNASNTSNFYATAGARGLMELMISPRFALAIQIEAAVVLTRIELIDTTTQMPFWTTPAAHGNIALRGHFTFFDGS